MTDHRSRTTGVGGADRDAGGRRATAWPVLAPVLLVVLVSVIGLASIGGDADRSAILASALAIVVSNGLSGWLAWQLAANGRAAQAGAGEQRISAGAPGVQGAPQCTPVDELSEARKSEERFRSLVMNASDVIVILDDDGAVTYQTPAAERVWGYRPRVLQGKRFLDLVHPDDISIAQNLLVQSLNNPRLNLGAELRLRNADQSWYHFEIIANNLLNDPSVAGIVATCRDISERKGLEKELAHQAFHDALSNLPNRALFMDRLGHALARADRIGSSVAVLFLDLDNFKVVNDSLGHQTGDRLLVATAERLRSCLRLADTAARLGGDEFTVLLEDISDVAEAIAVAERIQSELQVPFSLDGREMFTSVSVGIALSSPGHDRPDGLLRDADLAMYRAKTNGKARCEVFDRSLNAEAMARLELETDLRRAVERGEFIVYYQPIVLLEDGAISEVEALIRWQHPKRGFVSPMEFIPLAEETGLILQIGRQVLEDACRQARAWHDEFPSERPVVMSVNLSPRQLQHPELVDEVARVLAETGLEPSCLKLEITESGMMQDAESTIETLRRLKALGIQLAIDDFGTGYSSLAYLKRFPIDCLKVDRSFVDRLGQDPEDTAIVRAIITLAKTLSLAVTGEGIETAEQLSELRALGCDRGQGYYFNKPLPGIEVTAQLAGTTRLRSRAA